EDRRCDIVGQLLLTSRTRPSQTQTIEGPADVWRRPARVASCQSAGREPARVPVFTKQSPVLAAGGTSGQRSDHFFGGGATESRFTNTCATTWSTTTRVSPSLRRILRRSRSMADSAMSAI